MSIVLVEVGEEIIKDERRLESDWNIRAYELHNVSPCCGSRLSLRRKTATTQEFVCLGCREEYELSLATGLLKLTGENYKAAQIREKGYYGRWQDK